MSAIEKHREMTPAEIMEKVLLTGDLSKLTPDERVQYYSRTCESVGLNPLTRPLEYISLNGKLTLYARKDATDQLRAINQVSIGIIAREVVEGCYVVTAQAKLPSGRIDESIGAVPIEGLKGENRSNALMKCETKAKRRVTLSICGMGMLDESEIDSIPGARVGESSAPSVTSAPVTFGAPRKIEPLPPLAELVESANAATEKPIEYIDRPRQVNFAKSFREALPKALQPQAEKIRHAWLKMAGYIDSAGEPSSTMIRAVIFESVKAEAIEYAKNFQEVPF